MFVKAMEIIREEARCRKPRRVIRKRLLDETTLSKDEAEFLIAETLDDEVVKHAEWLLQQLVTESGIPEPMLKRLKSGDRTKTIAVLRTRWRRRLYAETRLSHAAVNKMLGLSNNSRHFSGGER